MAPTRGGGLEYPCLEQGCTKTFSRKEYLARHHRSKHSKERPFLCEYCERGFARTDLLKRHYQTCQEMKKKNGGEDGSGMGEDEAQMDLEGTGEGERADRLPVPPIASTSTSHSTSSAGPSYPHSSHLFPADPSLSVSSLPIPLRASYGTSSLASNIPSAAPAANAPTARSNQSDASASPDFFLHSPASLASTNATSNGGNSPDSSLLPASFGGAGETFPQPPLTTTSQPMPSLSAPYSSYPLSQQQQQQPHYPQPSLAPSYSPPLAPSAFKPGHSFETLAPGLSGHNGSFTQDEVLASEVLRDLMKSPVSMSGVAHAAFSGKGVGGAGGGAGGAEGVQKPWHGAMAAARADAMEGGPGPGNESVTLVDASGGVGGRWGGYFDASNGSSAGSGGGALTPTSAYLASLPSSSQQTLDVSHKLENSPAAQHLAEYFNKGGVGGITALDLGFPIEPSLWAGSEFLFNPPVLHDEDDRRFYLPEGKVCLGYLYPWHVPPTQTLSGYAKKAAQKLLPNIPVIHAASVNLADLPTHTAFALTVAGGAYAPEGQSFSNEMLVEKRVFLVRGFQAAEKSFDDRFASMQSLLLYQLLGLFHREEQQRLLSQSFHSALIYMLRSLDLPAKIKATSVPPVPAFPLVVPQSELDEAWKKWVEVETWRRVTFIIFLTDLEHSIATSSAQHLSLSDMSLDLPSSDRIWNASSSTQWHERASSALVPPSVSFLDAIKALMARTTPEPLSEQAALLHDLGRLSPFPLLILSRTLSFLEKKTEEALAQIDPFKNLLGGIGVVEDREQENRDVLTRIRKGREILRKLPGGIARGGGESWFEEVMPTSKGYKCTEPRPPSVPPAAYPSVDPLTSFDDPSSTSSSSSASASPTLAELLAEFDPQPYVPFYGHGGERKSEGETYEEAQERTRKLRELRTSEARSEFDFMT